MKWFTRFAVAMLSLAATMAHGLDIETLDGEEYKNVNVRAVEPTGVRITHSKGIAFIPFSNLSGYYQRKFGYDANKAKTTEAQPVKAPQRRPARVQTKVTLIEDLDPIRIRIGESGLEGLPPDRLFACTITFRDEGIKQIEIPNSGTVTIKPLGEGQEDPLTVPIEELETHSYFLYNHKPWHYEWVPREVGYRKSHKIFREPTYIYKSGSERKAVILSRQPEFRIEKLPPKVEQYYIVGPLLDTRLKEGMDLTLYFAGYGISHSGQGTVKVFTPAYRLAAALADAAETSGNKPVFEVFYGAE